MAAAAGGGVTAGGIDTTVPPATEAGTGAQAEVPLFAALPPEIQERGSLVFAGDSHPPYRTIETDGSFTGIDPDFQRALEAELGVEIEMEEVSGLPAILSGMLSGRYDAFNGPVRATAEREADFDAIVWLTTRTSYAFLLENADRFPSADELCGARIAGVEGSVTESQVELLNEWCVEQGDDPAEFVGFADTNGTILAVQSGRADALATTETGALDILRQMPDTFDYVTQTDEQGAGVDLLGMVTPKDSGLGDVLFRAVQNMFANGAYDEIVATWGLENVAVEEPLFNPITGGDDASTPTTATSTTGEES